jgi:spore maturation protein CgeB
MTVTGVLERLKAPLRRMDWPARLNAALKARTTRRLYDRTLAHYRALSAPHAAPGMPRLKRRRDDTLHLFFLGTDEQQDRSGMLQSLQKLGDVRHFTRADGSYGQNDPRPEAVRRQANANRLWELVSKEAHAGRTPDILIGQTWATLIDPAVFSRIRSEFGTLIVNIGMDDRHQFTGHRLGGSWSGTLGLIGHIDLALTAAPECADWYRKEGCPAIYFPEASDPDIFHPMPELPKIHDVSFVGGCYGIRRDIVTALRAAGIRVTTFGGGWNSGRIATEDVPRLFAQSKIVLGVGTIGHCRDFYALKMRDFDGPMSGSLYLTHDNSDLGGLFEIDREIVTYASVAECVQKALHYLHEDALRESVAAAGRARALRDHTWDLRFAGLFRKLGYPEDSPA